MGWSIDVARNSLKQIFKEEGRKFKITHPQAPYPTVDIHYSIPENGKDIGIGVKREIMALFPNDVYVNFLQLTAPEDRYVWDN